MGKALVDQRIEVHAAGNQIAPVFAVAEIDVMLGSDRLDRLDRVGGDQRYRAAGARHPGKEPRLSK